MPRDRAGSFTPVLVGKGQRHLDGWAGMITSLYAGGMTVRDIQHHLATTVGVDVPPATISTLTVAGTSAIQPLIPATVAAGAKASTAAAG